MLKRTPRRLCEANNGKLRPLTMILTPCQDIRDRNFPATRRKILLKDHVSVLYGCSTVSRCLESRLHATTLKEQIPKKLSKNLSDTALVLLLLPRSCGVPGRKTRSKRKISGTRVLRSVKVTPESQETSAAQAHSALGATTPNRTAGL